MTGYKLIAKRPGESRGRAIAGLIRDDNGRIGYARQNGAYGAPIAWDSREDAETVRGILAPRYPLHRFTVARHA